MLLLSLICVSWMAAWTWRHHMPPAAAAEISIAFPPSQAPWTPTAGEKEKVIKTLCLEGRFSKLGIWISSCPSTWELVEMQILGPYPRHSGVRPRNLCFRASSRRRWCMWEPESHQLRAGSQKQVACLRGRPPWWKHHQLLCSLWLGGKAHM